MKEREVKEQWLELVREEYREHGTPWHRAQALRAMADLEPDPLLADVLRAAADDVQEAHRREYGKARTTACHAMIPFHVMALRLKVQGVPSPCACSRQGMELVIIRSFLPFAWNSTKASAIRRCSKWMG